MSFLDDLESSTPAAVASGNQHALSSSVSSPEHEGSGRSKTTTFLVTTKFANQADCLVRRSWEDFEWAQKQLVEERAGIIVPVLPQFKVANAKQKFDETFVQDREVALNRFIQRVVGHPELVDAPSLLPFFTASPNDWNTIKEEMKKADVEASNHSSVNDAGDDPNNLVISSEEAPVVQKKKGMFGRWMSAKRDEWALRSKNLVLEETPAESKKFDDLQAYADHLETCIRILAEDSKALGDTLAKQSESFKTMGSAFSQLWGEHELSNTSSSTMYQRIGDIWNKLCKLVEEQNTFRHRYLESPFDELVLDVEALKGALEKRKKVLYEYTKRVQEGRKMQQQMDKLRGVSDLSHASDQYFALEREIRINDADLEQRKKLKDLITDRLFRDTDRFRVEWHERMRVILESYHREQIRFLKDQGTLWEGAMPVLKAVDDNRSALPTGAKQTESGELVISYTTSGAKATFSGSAETAPPVAVPEPAPLSSVAVSSSSFDSVVLDENAPMGGVAAPPPAAAPPSPPVADAGPSIKSVKRWVTMPTPFESGICVLLPPQPPPTTHHLLSSSVVSTMSGFQAAVLLALGASAGGIAVLAYQSLTPPSDSEENLYYQAQVDRRKRLPNLVLLVRHGESEGNADLTLFRTRADNFIELSNVGMEQAQEAGKRVEQILKTYEEDPNKPRIDRVHLIVSPFERTLQTALCMRRHFERRVVRTEIETRIREQEFGNLQGDDFQKFRDEQRTVGRFWYRFPTGESGSDVYDRVKSWWFESVLNVNSRVGYGKVDALVVVTHGLTMRFALMQLFNWSPTTFHSVWNAGNCDIYVLEKDLKKPGMSPYVLNGDLGEVPRSSVDLKVTYIDGTKQVFKLDDYLSIPPPRSTRLNFVKNMLVKQYPEVSREKIADVHYLIAGSGQGKSMSRMSSERLKNFETFHGAEQEFPIHRSGARKRRVNAPPLTFLGDLKARAWQWTQEMSKEAKPVLQKIKRCDSCLQEAKDKRARLPTLIILLRHGESEGNADLTLFRTRADNLIHLSAVGVEQAEAVGGRIEAVFNQYDTDPDKPNIERVHLVVSPFERTLQTAFCLRPHIEHRIVRTNIETRIREQEFGNLQGEDFQSLREEQKTVGRFWYRFPTGESGADVYDRVKSWWYESVLNVNCRVGYEHVDALVVVTHGLTMRFTLMQLFHWSPTTFHSVWNAGNCDMYVLEKDLQKPGMSPYILNDCLGDMPRSSVDLKVTFRNGHQHIFKLDDYLSIPPPRSTRIEHIKIKLAEQYATIDKEDIVDIHFDTGEHGLKKSLGGMSSMRRRKLAPYGVVTELDRQEFSCRYPNSTRQSYTEDPKELR
eukprot:Nitzschia sp. Nitz4//scaffold81_size91200//86431//90899//NITZ4_005004-RA/size91200-augustus-gene-0.81-mRNA-1//-1//CDS//3329558764//3465//frame0